MERKNMFAGLMRGRCHGFGMACILGLLLVQSCNPPESPAQRSQRRFRFIFANDIHFRGEKDAVMLAKVINEWKTEVQQWDFAVVAGDLTNHGNIDKMKLLKEHLDKMGKPYYPVIGNSDITAPATRGRKTISRCLENIEETTLSLQERGADISRFVKRRQETGQGPRVHQAVAQKDARVRPDNNADHRVFPLSASSRVAALWRVQFDRAVPAL